MNNTGSLSTHEDILIRDQMATMVGKYDKYMNRITLGREPKLESTGFLKTGISRAPFRVFGLPMISFLQANK